MGCGSKRVYIPQENGARNVPKKNVERTPEAPKVKMAPNRFKAPYRDVWLATIESIEWIKWPPAYANESEGVIRLKEAYIFLKAGKHVRSYAWPTKSDLANSNIDDYMEQVSIYRPQRSTVEFTQENMKVTLKKLTNGETAVNFDYSIRPYTYEGKIGYEVKSNGYIESVILERIRGNLQGKPVASARRLGESNLRAGSADVSH